MRTSTTWDTITDDPLARGWSVIDGLKAHQARLVREARRARSQAADLAHTTSFMTAAAMAEDYQRSLRASWRGGPSVLAFLFAPPDTDAMQMLDRRGEYLDARSGDTWDLFFPGYYTSEHPDLERKVGSRPIGRGFTANWFFSGQGFNSLRRHVEEASDGRWSYSGGVDLVLINAWIPPTGEPVVDWDSTQSGQLTDLATGMRSLTLGEIVERITRDFQRQLEDSAYGVGEVTDHTPSQPQDGAASRIMTGAIAGIITAIAKDLLGL